MDSRFHRIYKSYGCPVGQAQRANLWPEQNRGAGSRLHFAAGGDDTS
jgi:hypothetical protein